jgi:hypothetical protein
MRINQIALYVLVSVIRIIKTVSISKLTDTAQPNIYRSQFCYYYISPSNQISQLDHARQHVTCNSQATYPNLGMQKPIQKSIQKPTHTLPQTMPASTIVNPRSTCQGSLSPSSGPSVPGTDRRHTYVMKYQAK